MSIWNCTVRQASKLLELSERQVRRYIKSGRLVAGYEKIPVQVRTLVISMQSLDALRKERDDRRTNKSLHSE